MSPRIRIRHPGYRGQNTLITFLASEGRHRDHAHYATVWAACFIITNSNRNLWLSTSPSGESRAESDPDGLLSAGDYFLHVRSDDSQIPVPFPVVPNFRAWRFPHDNVPILWEQAAQGAEAGEPRIDGSLDSIAIESCRITGRQLEVDSAHIIPVSEKLWFTNNEMEEYAEMSGRSGEAIADTLSNILRLRCDAHRLWDKLKFSIVPRVGNNANPGPMWGTQVMSDGEELYKYWHGQLLQSLAGRPPHFLFARFAWDIFPKLHAFLQAGQKRHLVVHGSDGVPQCREFDAGECREFTVGQGKNRSASPKKRSRSGAAENAEDMQLISNCENGASAYSSSSPDTSDHETGTPHLLTKDDSYAFTDDDTWSWHLRGRDLSNDVRGRKRVRL